jgi:chromosome partitioning protein
MVGVGSIAMSRIVAVTNLKGGIGKTTTVVNLSAGLALKGARVLVVDVDAQGNLAMAFGLRPRRTLYEVLVDGARAADCITPARTNLDILAADESLLTAQPAIARRSDWPRVLEQAMRPVRSDYDFIFIDCGGSLTVLNLNALNAASDIVVPTTVEPFSLKGLEMLIGQINRVKGGSGSLRAIIPTMFDPRMRQSVDLLAQLRDRYGGLVLAPIRINVRLSEASAQGRSIYEYDPRSRGAIDYAQLVEQLSSVWSFSPAPPPAPRRVESAQRSQHNGAQPHVVARPTAPAAEPVVPVAPARPVAPASEPVVLGAGSMLSTSCPNCGGALRRTTVAGYRVAYCDHCRYRRQELANGR